MNEQEFIKNLSEICILKTENNFSNIPLFVYSHNNKYFDILNSIPVFSILNLMNIKYKVDAWGNFFLCDKKLPQFYEAQIISINNKLPELGLSQKSDCYALELQTNCNNMKFTIKYPLLSENNHAEEKIATKDNLYYQITNFNNIDYKFLSKCNNKNLYIDLRNNGGGSLQSMINVLNLFFMKNENMFMIGDKKNNYVIKATTSEIIKPLNIFLLVNEKTASSAEIFSLTLKRIFPVTVIGTETEGKWYLHKLIKHNDYYIKTPIYNYVSDDYSILNIGKGIIPDVKYDDNQIIEYINHILY